MKSRQGRKLTGKQSFFPRQRTKELIRLRRQVLKEGIADLILVGSKEEIEKNKGTYDISGAVIVDPAANDKTESYIAKLVELRQKKRYDRGAGT